MARMICIWGTWASLLLGSILAALFMTVRNAMVRSPTYDWLTIVG
jgi:hypothetical protein